LPQQKGRQAGLVPHDQQSSQIYDHSCHCKNTNKSTILIINIFTESLQKVLYDLFPNKCDDESLLICFICIFALAFRISAPKIWNSLPPHILQSQTLSLFRHHLNTHYFQSAYPAPSTHPQCVLILF